MAFRLVLLPDAVHEGFALLGRPFRSPRGHAVASNRGEDMCRLLAAHDGDARVRPRPQHSRTVCAPTHGVVAGTERAADHHRELRHAGAGDGGHHLRAVLGDAEVLVALAHHEAGDVLQEHERQAAPVRKLDEMRALEGGFREQDAVVGEHGDGHAVDVGEAAHQRVAVELLELVEIGAVHDPGDDFAHVVGRAGIDGQDSIELFRRIGGLAHRACVEGAAMAQMARGNGFPRQCQRMLVIGGKVVGHP